jgi:CheY-like chemotaxis protein/anti-sigma regulatory factor (Ser/Thr protein kinase)
VGNVVVLQEMLAPGALDTRQCAQAAEILGEVAEASDRIRRVVDDLRTFTRGDDEPHAGVDLVEVLDKTLRIAGHRIRHAASLERDYADASPVAGSFSQLGQVFLNLVMNAVHAIGDGDAHANQITVRARDTGDRVRIEISDTGRGMTEHVQSRIFDPFFTTREVGEGMGVGLTICHRVVSTLGGTISVRSRPGAGSTFTIELPRAERDAIAAPAPPDPEAPRALRVLAIDDEAFVVRTMQRQLGDHEVVAVSDGHAAVALLAADDAFDVVFCDVMMPVSSGLRVFAHVQAHHPHLVDRFVFLTAGAFGQTVDSALEATGRPVVHKPFTRAQLARHLPTR